MMKQIYTLKQEIPITLLCNALGIPRCEIYRCRHPKIQSKKPLSFQQKVHPRALGVDERARVLTALHSPRFMDDSPAEVYATLLEEGIYLCSERTMYRILKGQGETQERRNITRHGKYNKPELLATHPNQVWSWDITKLMGPQKWTYFYLYVLLDIFSRCVVGWMIADEECGALAKVFISEACTKEGITKESQLIIHSDRGGPMISKTVTNLMSDLGVLKSLSRPQVSNDNPFSEAQFKTLKYCLSFPERFGSIQDARIYCAAFFEWYNKQHKHSGIGYYTPHDVHTGKVFEVKKLRQETLTSAFEIHPERFVKQPPKASAIPEAAWINPPKNLPLVDSPVVNTHNSTQKLRKEIL